MLRMRWLPISLIAVFILLLAAMVWKSTRPSTPPPAPVSTVESVAQAPQPRAGNRPRPWISAVGENPIAASRVATKARIDNTVKAGRQRLQAQYSSERADPSWAMAREQSLAASSTSSQIADINVEPKDFHADCRSTTCRVTADFASRSNAEDWFSLFLVNTGTRMGKTSYQITANPDGTAHIEIYGTARD
jgi:hypothetical protein